MWQRYGMAHTLTPVQVLAGGGGVTLTNTNSGTTAYYTLDGSDPMGADGAVSSTAQTYRAGTVLPADADITIRACAQNNWGPLSYSKK
jgi:hypothetical protein